MTAGDNEYYLMMVTPLRLRAALGPEEFYRQQANVRLTCNMRTFPPPLYNLGAKLMLQQSSASNLQDHITRVHDLNGRISLVLLQAETEDNPGVDVATAVLGSSHRNPYTLEPMEYDATAETIGFKRLTDNPTEVCRIAIGNRAR